MQNEKSDDRLMTELNRIQSQKERNKEKLEKSENDFVRTILKQREKQNKPNTRASIYTIFTFIAFLINPAFGILVLFFCVADIIFNFLNLKE